MSDLEQHIRDALASRARRTPLANPEHPPDAVYTVPLPARARSLGNAVMAAAAVTAAVGLAWLIQRPGEQQRTTPAAEVPLIEVAGSPTFGPGVIQPLTSAIVSVDGSPPITVYTTVSFGTGPIETQCWATGNGIGCGGGSVGARSEGDEPDAPGLLMYRPVPAGTVRAELDTSAGTLTQQPVRGTVLFPVRGEPNLDSPIRFFDAAGAQLPWDRAPQRDPISTISTDGDQATVTQLGNAFNTTLARCLAAAAGVEIEVPEAAFHAPVTIPPGPSDTQALEAWPACVAQAGSIWDIEANDLTGPDRGRIDRVPVEATLLQGASNGYYWWLIPSAAINAHTNPCGEPFPGVEVVSGDSNGPGSEWDTAGVNYGEPAGITAYTCMPDEKDFDEGAWLDDPLRFDRGISRLGANDDPDSPWIVALAVHPSVTAIKITIDDLPAAVVETVTQPAHPEGPRYVAATVPPSSCQLMISLIAGDAPIANSTTTSELCD